MKERPILFSGEMVRAILDGRKTMTRRVIKPQPKLIEPSNRWYWEKALDINGHPLVDASRRWWEYYGTSPYGKPGDRLWVRETWQHFGNGSIGWEPVRSHVKYRSDGATLDRGEWASFADAPKQRWWNTGKCPWSPSTFMPRWASRLTLEVTGVRVERLQEITGADAIDKGTRCWICDGRLNGLSENDCACFHTKREAIPSFEVLWDQINGKKHPWESNPWVWVISFKPI